MLKFKYLIVKRDFPDVKAFQEYLNRLGQRSYELIQWQLISTNVITCNSIAQSISTTLSVLITWKIEDHDS